MEDFFCNKSPYPFWLIQWRPKAEKVLERKEAGPHYSFKEVTLNFLVNIDQLMFALPMVERSNCGILILLLPS